MFDRITTSTDSTMTSNGSTVVFVQGWVSIWEKMASWFRRRFKKKTKPLQEKYDVDEFFDVIKKGKQVTNTMLAQKYKDEIVRRIKIAQKLWQTKVIKELERQAKWLANEIRMINELWIINYVDEGDITELEEVWIKGRQLRRDAIDDYLWEIPKDVSDKIIEAKEAKVFDSLIILYTRPSSLKPERAPAKLDKSKTVTKKNRDRKTVDPICFWRIEWTNRLFFIADRMDDECDLTFSKIKKYVDEKSLLDMTK